MLEETFYLGGWFWFAIGVVFCCLALASRKIVIHIGTTTALFMALVCAMFKLTAGLMILLAVTSCVLFSVVYLRFWFVPVPAIATQNMRKKAHLMLGTQVSLQRGIKAGKGQAQIQDALWTVRCDTRLHAGAMVRVVGHVNSELEVEPLTGGKG